MASHTISVTVDSDRIQVTPDVLTMTSADDVRWAGANARRFSIVFDNEGAFGGRELDHSRAQAPNRPRAKGRFKYTVVSGENANVKLDPVVIVGDPPTTPNP
jgi:hypothetical protein